MAFEAGNEPIVHSYDVYRHAIRCGVSGHSNSTKHAKAVTCSACLRILAQLEEPASAERG
jgi:hypothetical protein